MDRLNTDHLRRQATGNVQPEHMIILAAAAELDALRAAAAWRDISPEHYGLEGIAWNGVCSGEVVSERGVWHWMNGMRCDPQPTLWMPLPPDPAA